MNDELDRLRAMLEAATPGSWESSRGQEGALDHVAASMLPEDDPPDLARCYGWRKVREPNARAIAALGTLWPALLAVAKAAEDAPNYGTQDASWALRAAIREHLDGES